MITPYLRFRSDRIEGTAHRLHRSLFDAGIRWAPFLPAGLPVDVYAAVASLTTEASCCSLSVAESLAAVGFHSIMITRPVVDPEGLRRMSQIIRDRRLTVTVDHFRQAEMLAEAIAADASVQLLIEVDLGWQSTGVRPGPDSVRLAQAAVKFPSLSLRGVLADDGRSLIANHHAQTSRAGQALRAGQASIEEVLGIAGHCRRMIEMEGIDCPETVSGKSLAGHLTGRVSASLSPASKTSADDTSTGGLSICSDPLLSSGKLSTCLASPLVPDGSRASTKDTTPWGLTPGSEQQLVPAVELICRVISRPSLEWCVINAGRGAVEDIQSAITTAPCGGHVVHSDEDVATVMLSGDALDLRIGDEVALVTDCLTSAIARLPHRVYPGGDRLLH